MPLSGYTASAASGYGVSFFGIDLPTFFTERHGEISHLAITIHVYGAYILTGLLILHIAAPFKHYFIDKINIFRRIIF